MSKLARGSPGMATRVRSRYDAAPARLAMATTITSARVGSNPARDVVVVIVNPPSRDGTVCSRARGRDSVHSDAGVRNAIDAPIRRMGFPQDTPGIAARIASELTTRWDAVLWWSRR